MSNPAMRDLRGLPVEGYGEPAEVATVLGTWSDDGLDQPLVSLYLPAMGRFVGCQRVLAFQSATGGRAVRQRTVLLYAGPGGGGATVTKPEGRAVA